ncbi:MAG: DMT family transporter [candidate division Zixibacteria bacterium]
MGQVFAIATAVVWAFAVILFKKSGENVHPVALNFYKNLLAMTLLVPTIMIFGDGFTDSFTTREYTILLVSGALGIGLADTFFFKSLNLLGAGLSAIVDCLYSPSIIILSFFWLGESLTPLQILGLAMIISAVLTVSRSDKNGHISHKNLIWGIFWGALAMGTMAVGIVMIKPLLETASFFMLTELRLAGGMIILLIIIPFYPRWKQIMLPKLNRKGFTYLISGSFLGAYVAMILWLAGMKFTTVSIAAALNQTSNIFIFVFAAMFLKEPITPRRTVGIVLGVVGAFIVTFG